MISHGVRRAVHQPGPHRGHHPAGAHRRHRADPCSSVAARPPSIKEAVCKGTVSALSGARLASPARTSGSRAASGRAPSRPATVPRPMTGTPATTTPSGSRCCGRCCSPSPTRSSGSATEADDVLQDSYLRWAEVDLATVRDTKSYLAQLVTRQALNALRADARRREDYVGPWLPEPLLLDEQDPSADVVLAESVSMAMLVRAGDAEPRRAGRVRAARGVRVRLRRNRLRGGQAAPRPCARSPTGPGSTCRPGASGSSRSTRSAARGSPREFLAAAASGDVEALMAMLAPDVPGPPTAAARPARPAGRWSARRRSPG